MLAFFSLAPNLIWLAYSTARITNTGDEILRSVIVHVDDEQTILGELEPGKSRFIILPNSGDATFKVSYVKGTNTETVCQEYAEGDMYHIETLLSDNKGSKCISTLPLVSDLLILKALSYDVI
jgi:hypothetical protein